MKQKLQKIAFYYFVAASVSAYLITVISLIANQNWHEYFVSPVYLYCQLLPAGSILGMPTEIILSCLSCLFVSVLYSILPKKRIIQCSHSPYCWGILFYWPL